MASPGCLRVAAFVAACVPLSCVDVDADDAPLDDFDDEPGRHTEEIDPAWRPEPGRRTGDEEDTGITSQAIFGPFATEDPPPDRPSTAGSAGDDEPAGVHGTLPGDQDGPGWMIAVAGIVAVLVLIGLALALL